MFAADPDQLKKEKYNPLNKGYSVNTANNRNVGTKQNAKNKYFCFFV